MWHARHRAVYKFIWDEYFFVINLIQSMINNSSLTVRSPNSLWIQIISCCDFGRRELVSWFKSPSLTEIREDDWACEYFSLLLFGPNVTSSRSLAKNKQHHWVTDLQEHSPGICPWLSQRSPPMMPSQRFWSLWRTLPQLVDIELISPWACFKTFRCYQSCCYKGPWEFVKEIIESVYFEWVFLV